ncbi:RHS repeat-associated core domain-containing protein [Actinoplanes sp. NPDC051411]|uniref:RHS repeat domain-containing protein n=1 Tax=Actinoplanes sp. NPDC051411 TaxID=3155522 RepID=UPI003420B406
MSLHIPTWARRLRRTAGIAGLTLAVTVGVVSVPAAANAAPKARKAQMQTEKSVPAGPRAKIKKRPANPVVAARLTAPGPVAWPAASDRVVKVAGKAASPATPIAVTGSASAPSTVRVRTLDHAASEKFGSPLGFQLSRADGGTAGGTVDVAVSYDAVAQAYGADYASRLRLATVPACAQTTPAAAACQPVPVPSANHPATGTVTADVALAPAAAMTTLTLTSGPSGDAGDFTATPLKASSTWSAGGQSGDFSWSYPMRVPPALNGPAPDVELGYSSQSVDGELGATNNQPGQIGEGFSYDPGSISRTYKPCAADMGGGATNTTKTGDLCWGTDNATLSLSGHSGELIKDDSGAGWHLKSDDNTKIQKLNDTSLANGDKDGEYWLVTTTDGTKYYFGLNHLQGWTSGKPVTNSVNTVPVYGNNSGEACYDPTFSKAFCDQAWQWNLDYVVDPRGNTESLWYTPEKNYYARDNTSSTVSQYVRGSYLTEIDYGTDQRTTKTDSDLTGKAPMKVVFGAADRCLKDAVCDLAHPASWPDVPWDQNCTSSTSCKDFSPTFFTQKRLDTVTTYVLNSGKTGWDPVEKWTLHQSYPDPGDRTRAGLWLDSISHAGIYGGANTTMPDVQFTGIQLQNRVDTQNDNLAKMNWWRISSILTETGELIGVTYSAKDCAVGSTPAPDNNSTRCYPVWWTRPGNMNPSIDWFNKYVVTSISENDQTGGGPRVYTEYKYDSTGPMWHYDDDNGLVKDAQKTWGQWRGYSTVTTTVGDAGDPQTQTKTLFFQGMNGDKTSTGTRTVNVVDSAKKAVPDDDPFAGQVREQIIYNGAGGDELSGVINDMWKSAKPTATRKIAGYTKSAYHTGISATYNRAALDGGRGYQRTETDTTFDDTYGQPTQILDKGDTSRTDDDICTVNTYDRNTGLNILDTVERIQKFTSSCATPASESGVISDEEDSFDGLGFGAAPTFGDISKVQKAKAWTSPTNITWITVSTSAFDAYGRENDNADVRGNHTVTVYTPASGGPVTQTTKTAGPNNWVTTTDINPAWGLPTDTVDLNHKRNDVTYDGLGRKTGVWLANRTKAAPASQSASATFSYQVSQADNVPTVVTTKVINATGNYNTTYALYDGLLRDRQQQKAGIAPSKDSAAGTVITDTLYNSLGEKVRTDGPYFNGNVSASAALVARPVNETSVDSATTDTYDGAGRVVAESTLVNNFTKWSTTTYYGGDHTDVTPPAGGTPTSTITDALGRTVETREYPATTPTGSVYNSSKTTYNAKGRRSAATDDVGNRWTFTYDLLGRTIQQTDPDSGDTTSTYSDAGDVLTTADANNTADPSHNPVLVYDYDALGRKIGEYLGSKTGTKLANWTYDTVSQGQLGSSSSFVNGNEYKSAIIGYTPLYKAAGTTVTLPPSEGSLAGSYTVSSTYDVDGSVNSISLPATGDLPSENLNYSYNQADGHAYSLKTDFGTTTKQIVYGTQYTSYGEQAITTFSDSMTSPWAQQVLTYEPGTRRLVENKTLHSVGASTVADVHSTYDPAGNITELADTPGAGTSEIQCFTYDSLRRLTQAWTPGTDDCSATPSATMLGGAAPYWKSWTFDGTGVDNSTGNRLSETTHTTGGDTVVASAYSDPAHPHAVTATTTNGAATGSFAYDPDGNTTSRPGTTGQQTLTWDRHGHLASVTDASGTSTYIYDADGDRLMEHDSTGTTAYLDGAELRLHTSDGAKTAVRYYSFNGQTVAQRNAAGLQFLTGDAHGTSSVAIADTAAEAVTKRYQDPYGNAVGPAVAWTGTKTFVGGDQDTTGLIHEGAREYDPALGRFVSVDPLQDLSDPQQWNGYAYAGNNPILNTDPSGTMYPADGGAGYQGKAVPPTVHNPRLGNILDGIYARSQTRAEGLAGDGKLGTAIRAEITGGRMVRGGGGTDSDKIRWHYQKGAEEFQALSKLLNGDRKASLNGGSGLLTDAEREIALSEAKELWDALNTDEGNSGFTARMSETESGKASLETGKRILKLATENNPANAEITGATYEPRIRDGEIKGMSQTSGAKFSGVAGALSVVGDIDMAHQFGKALSSDDPNAIPEFECSMGIPCAGPIGTDNAGNVYTRDNQGNVHVTPAA